MLAALAAAALFQTGEIAPGNLTYSEVYACSTLARAGWESMYEGGTSPVTTGERAREAAFRRLEELAEAEKEPSRLRDGLEGAAIEGAEAAARDILAEVTPDQRRYAREQCAQIFGVTLG